MKLYCVRHGEAETSDVNPERPLTEKGQKDIENMARFMGEANLHIDDLLHSPKQRTTETAVIFAKYLQAGQVTQALPLLDEDQAIAPLLALLPTWSQDTMLVGHLPFLSRLVGALVVGHEVMTPIVNCPPGTVVCLDHYKAQYWVISWLLTPDRLPGR